MSWQAQEITNNHCPLKRNRCTVLTAWIFSIYDFFYLGALTASKQACYPFKKRPKNNSEIKNKQIDIRNQLISDYYTAHNAFSRFTLWDLIVSVSFGGCLRFRLCENNRSLFVWERDSIFWMWLTAGVTVPESKNRRKAILKFPGSFVKLTAAI